jgi:hypothetical protein
MNFLPEKKYGVPLHNFVEKNVLCEKGDGITRFDGTFFMGCRTKAPTLYIPSLLSFSFYL